MEPTWAADLRPEATGTVALVVFWHGAVLEALELGTAGSIAHVRGWAVSTLSRLQGAGGNGGESTRMRSARDRVL
jgi:hypothetical protein